MTLVESIAHASASLPLEKQREVMDFVEFLKTRPGRARHPAPRMKPRGFKAPAGLPLALSEVYGIWADRSDLPKDPVAAVKILRKRTAERRANG